MGFESVLRHWLGRISSLLLGWTLMMAIHCKIPTWEIFQYIAKVINLMMASQISISPHRISSSRFPWWKICSGKPTQGFRVKGVPSFILPRTWEIRQAMPRGNDVMSSQRRNPGRGRSLSLLPKNGRNPVKLPGVEI